MAMHVPQPFCTANACRLLWTASSRMRLKPCASLAVPSIWYMHERAGGFHDLFMTLCGCAGVVLLAALMLPYRRHGSEAVPAE